MKYCPTPLSPSDRCLCRYWAFSPAGMRTRLSAHFMQGSKLKTRSPMLREQQPRIVKVHFSLPVKWYRDHPLHIYLVFSIPSLSPSDVYLPSFALAYALSRQVAQACSGQDTNSFQLPSLNSSSFTMKTLLWETTMICNKVSSCWKSLQ